MGRGGGEKIIIRKQRITVMWSQDIMFCSKPKRKGTVDSRPISFTNEYSVLNKYHE
jgi:hypothetical protein